MAEQDAAAGGQIPYIGSLISLVSASGQRYKGTLYTVDLNESTIALQNVTLGADDAAPGPVYEFIKFRGSDIAELTVLANGPAPDAATGQAAQAPPAPPAPEQPTAGGAPIAPSAPQVTGWTQPPALGAAPGAPIPPPAPQPPAPGAPAPPRAPAPTVLLTPAAPPRQPPPPGQQPGGQPWPPPQQGGQQQQPRRGGPPGHQQQPNGHAGGRRGDGGRDGGRGGRGRGGRGRGGSGGEGGRGDGGRGEGGRIDSGGRGEGGRGRGGGRGAGRAPQIRGPVGELAPAAVRPADMPKADFDFEEALAKFNKADLQQEQEGEQVAEKEAAKPVYEKDDFFDSLSCEALERLALREAGEDARVDGRARNAAQRKVDTETFGTASAGRFGGRRRSYGRGRGRGGRGYGGGRGGGGRGVETVGGGDAGRGGGQSAVAASA